MLQNLEFIDACPLKDIQFIRMMLWETLLPQLRGVFINYAAITKRNSSMIEENNALLDQLEQECKTPLSIYVWEMSRRYYNNEFEEYHL